MLRKSFVIFGMALVSGCGSAPKVSPCFVRPDSGGCFYAPLDSEEVLLRTFQAMDKNICYTPEEHQAIIEWIKRHGGKRVSKAFVPYETNLNVVMERANVYSRQ